MSWSRGTEGLDVFVVHAVAPQKLGADDNIRTGPGAGQRPRDKLGALLPPDASVTEVLPGGTNSTRCCVRLAPAQVRPRPTACSRACCVPRRALKTPAWCGLNSTTPWMEEVEPRREQRLRRRSRRRRAAARTVGVIVGADARHARRHRVRACAVAPGRDLFARPNSSKDGRPVSRLRLGFSTGGDRELRVLSPEARSSSKTWYVCRNELKRGHRRGGCEAKAARRIPSNTCAPGCSCCNDERDTDALH